MSAWQAASVLFVVGTLVSSVLGVGSGNPFTTSGVKFYVNNDFLMEVQASMDLAKGNSTFVDRAAKFQHVPSAYWLDTMAKLGKLMVMQEEAVNFAAQVSAPVLTSFVVYDVPTRDCYALSSNGEIQLKGSYEGPSGSVNGIEFYKQAYIDPIYSVIKRYTGLTPKILTVLFIEPDSLPNIVTNKNGRNCSEEVCQAYVTAQTYTIKALGKLDDVWMYMDLAHGGWLGYKDNLAKAHEPFAEVLKGQESLIRGFVTNSANYSPLLFTSGWKDMTSADTDYCLDELSYIGALMGANSLFSNKKYIVDTGRNGKPGIRRTMGNWCNIYNTGIGYLPGAYTSGKISLSSQSCPDTEVYGTNVRKFCQDNAKKGEAALDALWWVKTPGESDGISENKPGARLDAMCQSEDSWWKSTKGTDAPEAGHWFHLFFMDLVINAIEVPTSVDYCAPNPCRNLGKCSGQGKCTCAGGWQGEHCETAPTGCSPNPCKNYGTCSSGGKCTCPKGFSGDTCEETSGACDSNPGNQCFNGGACSGSPWRCACKSGFSGTMCQNAPKCEGEPCKNGGSCFGSPLGFSCFCPRGWMGPTCEQASGAEIDDPIIQPCGGSCTGAHQICRNEQCECEDGYVMKGGGLNECTERPGGGNTTVTCKANSCPQGQTCSVVNNAVKCSGGGGGAKSTAGGGGQTRSTGNGGGGTTNKCTIDNGGCDEKCSYSAAAGVKCSCTSANKKLGDDGKSCVSDDGGDGGDDEHDNGEDCLAEGVCGKYALDCEYRNNKPSCLCKPGYQLAEKTATECTKVPANTVCEKCQGYCNEDTETCACNKPWKLASDGVGCVSASAAGGDDGGSGGGSNLLIIILIVVVALLVIGVVAYVLYNRSKQQQFAKATTQMGSTTGAPYGTAPYQPPAANTGYYGQTNAAPRPPPPRM